MTLGRIDRRTCLGALAAPMMLPAREQLQSAQALPATAPRLLFTRDELTGMRARSGHPQLARLRDAVISRATATLTAPPLVPSITLRGEPDPPGEDKGLSCARALQGRVFTLGMAWELTGDTRYLEHAVVQLEHAVRDWRIWVDTAHPSPFDLMTGELSLTFGVAIDWLLPAVDAARRDALVKGVIRRGLDAYLEAVERATPPRWHTAENNWNTVCNGGAVVLALALQDLAADKAERTLRRGVPAMDHYWEHLRDDGGWDEGTGYWRYGHRYALMAAEALRRAGNPAGDTVFARPGVRQTGYFPLVFNPGTRLAAGFGDSNSRAYDPIFYFLGARYREAAFIWYQDRAPLDAARVGWPDAALALIWRPVDEPWLPEAVAGYVPNIPRAAVFPAIGWALLAPSQPDPRHFLSFKNGSLAASHTHLDLNHISVGVDDEMLLIELGNRPYPADYFRADRRYGYYEIGTRGHNTVMIGGRGQVHGRKGRLLPLAEHDGLRILSGVADDTYEVAARIARRHVCTLEDGALYLVLDQIETVEAQPIELRFHTAGTWTIGTGGALQVKGESARAALRVRATDTDPVLSIQPAEGWIRPVTVLRAEREPTTRHLVATLIAPGASDAPDLTVTRSDDGTSVRVRVGQRDLAFTLDDEHGLQVGARAR